MARQWMECLLKFVLHFVPVKCLIHMYFKVKYLLQWCFVNISLLHSILKHIQKVQQINV
jgi:hypothetical protein